jgi:hypothetical protein
MRHHIVSIDKSVNRFVSPRPGDMGAGTEVGRARDLRITDVAPRSSSGSSGGHAVTRLDAGQGWTVMRESTSDPILIRPIPGKIRAATRTIRRPTASTKKKPGMTNASAHDVDLRQTLVHSVPPADTLTRSSRRWEASTKHEAPRIAPAGSPGDLLAGASASTGPSYSSLHVATRRWRSTSRLRARRAGVGRPRRRPTPLAR